MIEEHETYYKIWKRIRLQIKLIKKQQKLYNINKKIEYHRTKENMELNQRKYKNIKLNNKIHKEIKLCKEAINNKKYDEMTLLIELYEKQKNSIEKKLNIMKETYRILELKKRQEILNQELNKFDMNLKINKTIEKLNNKIKYQEDKNKSIELKNKMNEIKKNNKIINELELINNKYKYNVLQKEIHELENVLSIIKKNEELDEEISRNIEIIKYLNYIKLKDEIKSIEEDLEDKKIKLQSYKKARDIISLQEKIETLVKNIKEVEENIAANKKMNNLNSKLQYQKEKKKKIELEETLLNNKKDKELKEETIKINEKIKDIIKIKTELVKKYEKNLVKENELENKNKRIIQLKESILKLEKEIKEKEEEGKIKEEYKNLMGAKGIQTKIIHKKLKLMQDHINEILENYTKYKIKIEIKTTGTSIIPNISTINRETENELIINKLSTYETLILSVAFKRALNKYSRQNKSGIFIMDEGAECMDQDNFEKNLPNLIDFIMEDYSMSMIISQRDIKKITENTIKIKKEGTNSVIDNL